VISQTTATRYFDGVDRAIGRHLSLQNGDAKITYQVVGVSSTLPTPIGPKRRRRGCGFPSRRRHDA
jgi:hypothetical protein